jgi:hypothetical protein
MMNGQTYGLKQDDSHWEINYDFGLNTDGIETGLGITYFASEYFGLRASFNIATEIEQLGNWVNEEYLDFYNYATRFKFIPSAVIRTPRLIEYANGDGGVYLFAQPGIVLSPGASGSTDAKFCNWDFKSGINFVYEDFIFSIAYGISNFSLYSGNPNSAIDIPAKSEHTTHTCQLSAAFCF